MFCRICGKEISETVQFCPKCGAKVVKNDTPKNGVSGKNNYYIKPDAGPAYKRMETPGRAERAAAAKSPHKSKPVVKPLYAGVGIGIIVLVILAAILIKVFVGGRGQDGSVTAKSDKETVTVVSGYDNSQGEGKKSADGQETYQAAENSGTDISEDSQSTWSSRESNNAGTKEMETYIEEVDEYEEDTVEEESEFIIPDSDTRLISRSELVVLTQKEVRTALNEIYARHGYIFETPEWKEYFEGCSWYKGTIPKDQFTEDMLSEIERTNKDTIVEYEKEMGYR